MLCVTVWRQLWRRRWWRWHEIG